MKPLDWTEIYRVSDKRRLPTQNEVDVLQKSCGRLPDGYLEFITEFGFGELDGIHVMLPEYVADQTPVLRDLLSEWRCGCEDFDQPLIIPPQSIEDGVPLAKTEWGDYYFCSSSDPGVLWYLWRPHDWDSNPSILPLGFRNPFLHQEPGREPEELGSDGLIFDSCRERFSQSVYVTGKNLTADESSGLPTLIRDVLAPLPADKTVDFDFGSIVYLKKWGAQIQIVFHPQENRFVLFASMDLEHDCREFLSTVEQKGYMLEPSN